MAKDSLREPAVPSKGVQSAGLVDIHCHLLPGIDDGPPTLDDAVALAQAFVAQGADLVVATPHVSEAYAPRPDLLHERIVQLRKALQERVVPLEVRLGAEVALSVALELPDETLRELAIGGKRWILLEPPHGDVYPFGLSDTIRELRARGFSTLVAHPERNLHLRERRDILREARAAGSVLQITGSSLLGGFGRAAKRTAWELLQEGLVHVVASDAHDVERRPPEIRLTWQAIAGRLDAHSADLLHRRAPAAIAAGAGEPDIEALIGPGPEKRRFRLLSRRGPEARARRHALPYSNDGAPGKGRAS